jgi:hypothetical protein
MEQYQTQSKSEIISNIIIQDEFISQAEVDTLLASYNIAQIKTNSRTEIYDNMGPVNEIVDKVIRLVKEKFHKEVYLDYAVLITRADGDFCAVHCDNTILDCPRHGFIQEELEKVGCKCADAVYRPNHAAQRDYTGLLYLDSKHKGGEIVFHDGIFPKIYTKSIEAVAGRLVLSPNNPYYYHQTTPVTEGIRISLNMWFTLDRASSWYLRNYGTII